MRISFCTPAKGRTEFLRRTYLRNVANALAAIGQEQAEFILLNMDSPDDMDVWAKCQLLPFIRDGIVRYYRAAAPYPVYFIPQADNTAMRLGSGQVVSNMMADAILSPAYFQSLPRFLESGAGRDMVTPPLRVRRGATGLISMYRSDFERLGGYDESLVGWGYQDYDLIARGQAAGLRCRYWNVTGCSCVPHDDKLRVQFSPIHNEQILQTNRHHQLLSQRNIQAGRLQANAGRPWGAIAVMEWKPG
jgi:N-terminal domain of galactosyltransferase